MIAGKLTSFARLLVIDEPFVRRRLAAVEKLFEKHDVIANTPALLEMLTDARAELAEGRFEAANLVLDVISKGANTAIAERP